MTAAILTMQYKFCNVLIGDKNGYNSLQLTVYMGNLFATSKWNGHNIVHKNHSCHDFSILCGYLPYACSDELVNCSWKKYIQYPMLFVCLPSQITIF